MSQCIDRNPSCKIQVFPILNVPKIASFAFHKHWRRSSVGLDHISRLFVDEGCGGRVWCWIGIGKACFSLRILLSVCFFLSQRMTYVDIISDFL